MPAPTKENGWTIKPGPNSTKFEFLNRESGSVAITRKFKKVLEDEGKWGQYPFDSMQMLPAGLIVIQPDLGTAVLVIGSGLFVIFLAGISWWWIAGIALTGAASLPIVWQFMRDYQKNRVYQFLSPDSDPLGSGWQTIQSKIAVGSGGWSGKGWTHGTQSQLEFLPERHTDFVLAVFSEEFGWIGVTVLMLIYAFVVGRALWIAANARDSYGRLLGGAIAMTFFVYTLVNSAMITGMMPVKGVPLPLISYGGTSAVSLLVAFGILMSIHAHRRG